MKLAALVGISVASVEYRKFGSEPVLVVKRFDRNLVNDSLVQRVHIIDGCQALNLPPTHKYERNFGSGKDVKQIRDGASLKALHEVAKSCEVPAIAILQMLNWMIFNLCISNADSHAKNISYFVSKQGLSLTPFYDLVNIAVYPDLEQDLAMSIGDEFQLENVKAFQFSEFCSEINMPKKMFLTQFRKIGKALLASLDQKQGLLPLELSADELMFAESLMDNIKKRTQELLVNVEEVIHI